MSRPTEIMLVASATSTAFLSRAGQPKPRFGLRDLVGADTREVSSWISRSARSANGCAGGSRRTPLRAVAGQMRAHLVLDDTARAAEFAQSVEIAEGRQIGIGGIVDVRSADSARRRPRAVSAASRRKTSFGPRPGAATPT